MLLPIFQSLAFLSFENYLYDKITLLILVHIRLIIIYFIFNIFSILDFFNFIIKNFI